MNLGWKLALVERGLASSSLLSSYTKERLPVVTDTLKITTALFDQLVASKLDTTPKALELRQFGVNYRWSSIVVDDGLRSSDKPVGTYGALRDKVHAGDRAPDAPGLVNLETGVTTSIFQILSSSLHTAFVLADTADKAAPFFDILKTCPPGTLQLAWVLPNNIEFTEKPISYGLTLQDRGGHTYWSYLPDGGLRVVVVRPDSFVGALVSNTDGLKKYLKLIFSA
jgi:FAD binding domain